MANITETDTYDAGVYLLATTDPVQGGTPSSPGVSNAPLINLANRTHYLNKRAFGINQTQKLMGDSADPDGVGARYGVEYPNTTGRTVFWVVYLASSTSTAQVKLEWGVHGTAFGVNDYTLINVTSSNWTTVALMVGENHKYRLSVVTGTMSPAAYAQGTSYTEI